MIRLKTGGLSAFATVFRCGAPFPVTCSGKMAFATAVVRQKHLVKFIFCRGPSLNPCLKSPRAELSVNLAVGESHSFKASPGAHRPS